MDITALPFPLLLDHSTAEIHSQVSGSFPPSPTAAVLGLLTNAHSARGSPLVRTGLGAVGVRINRVYLEVKNKMIPFICVLAQIPRRPAHGWMLENTCRERQLGKGSACVGEGAALLSSQLNPPHHAQLTPALIGRRHDVVVQIPGAPQESSALAKQGSSSHGS